MKKCIHLYIGEYNIFDTSTICSIDKNLIYSDSNYNYYIECASIDTLYLVNDKTKIKLKTALENNEINIDYLFKTNLKISKEDKNETSN